MLSKHQILSTSYTWERWLEAGENADMMTSDSETLNDFVYASKLMQRMRSNLK